MPPSPTVEGQTLREWLEETHNSDEGCASCHGLMDPVGYAFERFDPTGAYRQLDNGLPIDSSGQRRTAWAPSPTRRSWPRSSATIPRTPGCVVRNLYRSTLGHREGIDQADGIALLDESFAETDHNYKSFAGRADPQPAVPPGGRPQVAQRPLTERRPVIMHPLRKFKLSRRTVLRGMAGGAAVSVALPPLEAMMNDHGTALANGEGLPTRFISFFWGNGVMLDRFEPTTQGPDWELTEELAPFAPVKEYVSVLTGIMNRCEDIITHHEGMTAFSGYTFTPAGGGGFASNFGGPTIDQLIADAIADRFTTPIRSMQVQCSKGFSPADNGTTATTISVRGEPGNLTPLYAQTNPVDVWTSIFGEFVPQPDDSALRLSILDAVREDADRLRPRLGAVDNQRLDAHFEGLAELEQKIVAVPPTCDLPTQPTHANGESVNNEQLTLVNQLMSEMIAYAFVCDITRVASNLFLPLAGESVFAESPSGSGSTQHVLSHQGGESYHEGIVYIMERFSQMLQILGSTPDFDGSNLLDSTIVYGSSDCSIGWSHSIRRQPIILAGTGRGYLVNPGIHYQEIAAADPNANNAPSEGNMSDVLLALLQAFDPGATSVGGGSAQSNSPLTDILA